MNFEVPTIDSCCEKEVYAFFGLAAYCAQLVEYSALNLALVLRLAKADSVSQMRFDELYASLGKQTLGRLLETAKSIIQIPEDSLYYIEEALELRNTLIHHYFRGHAEDFVSEKGRHEMMQELQLIISKLIKADIALEKVYAPLWEKYGVTEEFIEAELERIRKNAEARDSRA